MKRFVFLLFVATTLVVSLPTEGAVTVTLILDASSPRPLGTSLVANGEDFFLVTAEGAVRVVTGFPISRGWFDPSGLGRLRRTGQVFSDMPYGSVIGTFGSTLGLGFYVGDIATWDAQPVDVGDEFKVGLNMSVADQGGMDGFFQVHVVKIGNLVITAVGDPDFSELPGGDRIFLEQNAPNPFNPNTKIRFTLARPQRAKIFVSNLAGDHVALLEERSYDAGTHTVTWNGCDAVGREVASGTYIVRLEAEDGVQARKVMLVR